MVTVVSSSGHAETLGRLLEAIASRGLTVFAQIDHAAAAREVDMELADEIVVVFGNPRAGTPLMQEDPRIGLDLPLRMLVWGSDDQAILGYHDPRELSGSYDIVEHGSTIDAMSSLLADLAGEAAAQHTPTGEA